MNQNNSLAMFENESIGKLMLKFSLPAIASMVVNSIYNIVDQIFIGQGVGMYGNAATNLTFPLVTIAMAIGTLIADGCVAYFSLKLGQKNYDEAARTMGNGITISLLAGLFITLSMELLLTPVLNLCGGTKVAEETFRYATEYARITLIGIPFVCISMTVTSIIRAQGNPRYAMISNISGCLLNVVLDAWFVLGLDWGVAGAAWATIIGQVLNFVLAVAYIPRLKGIKFKREYAIIRKNTLFSFLPLGISSFFTQFGSTIVVICVNNLTVKYGIQSIYGPDIPLAAFGIVMKVNSIIVSVMVGLGIGSQPIVGYNYGAKKLERVKEAFFCQFLVCVGYTTVFWLLILFLPRVFAGIFTSDGALVDYTAWAIRIFLAGTFSVGFQVSCQLAFMALGQAKISLIMACLRKLILLIPLIFILPNFFADKAFAVFLAEPVSDILAAAVTTITFFTFFRKLLKAGKQ